MTIEKRFPDLTDRASEIEQGLIHTYIHTSKIHYAHWYTFTFSNKHLKYVRAQEYIKDKRSLPRYFSQSIAFKPLKVSFTLPKHRGKMVQNRVKLF